MADNTALGDLREVLSLLARDPLAAADRIDAIANRLHEQAEAIRSRFRSEDPYTVPGGMTDRVKANVIGPDGQIKQSIDTGRN